MAPGDGTDDKSSAYPNAFRGYQKSSSMFFHRGDIEVRVRLPFGTFGDWKNSINQKSGHELFLAEEVETGVIGSALPSAL